MSIKTNDQLMAIYLSSLIRAITAFHDLIENKIQNRQAQEEKDGAAGGTKEGEDGEGGEGAAAGKKQGDNKSGGANGKGDKDKVNGVNGVREKEGDDAGGGGGGQSRANRDGGEWVCHI